MEEDRLRSRPLAILLVAQRSGYSEETLFVYPFQLDSSCLPPPVVSPLDALIAGTTVPGLGTSLFKSSLRDVKRPVLHQVKPKEMDQRSFNCVFGFSPAMLASILCVKDACLDHALELKIDNIRFAGYPKKVSRTFPGSTAKMFGINFILSPNVDPHVVCSFQRLAKKLAVAIDTVQEMNGFLDREMGEMIAVLEEMENEQRIVDNEYFRVLYKAMMERSSLAATLAKVFEDVTETGTVHVFLDNFIEVSFCAESRALPYASLPPRSRNDLEKLIKQIRPYHGVLLLKDVWPNPDTNPSVALLIKHCTPDKSILSLSVATGIPVLQVLLIVRHLLLWARVIIIFPLANTNIYTSATFTRTAIHVPDDMEVEWSDDQLTIALSYFCPYATLGGFIENQSPLIDQQVRARVIKYLLRHQLIMQLHRYYYVMRPATGAVLPKPSKKCPESLKKIVATTKLEKDLADLVCNLLAVQLEKESYKRVETRLLYFVQLLPYLNGEHHVEDLMYRLNESRNTLVSEELELMREEPRENTESVLFTVVDAFSLIIADFLRPDEISALSFHSGPTLHW